MNEKTSTQWHEVLPNGSPYAVTLFSPSNDVEQTLCDVNGKRADHVLCGAGVSIAEGDENGKPTESGVRFGFLIVGDRDVVMAKELYEEQAVMAATQLIDNFYTAMREVFGVNAVKVAAEILYQVEEEKLRVVQAMLATRKSN